MTAFWNIAEFLLRVIHTRAKYGLGKGVDVTVCEIKLLLLLLEEWFYIIVVVIQ